MEALKLDEQIDNTYVKQMKQEKMAAMLSSHILSSDDNAYGSGQLSIATSPMNKRLVPQYRSDDSLGPPPT